jgi:hypothetical protein
MRGLSMRACWVVLLLAGCGFDSTLPAQGSSGAAGNGSGIGGVPSTSGGMPSAVGGSSSAAGQPMAGAGMAGMPITPAGGSGGQAGAPAGAAGSASGGSNSGGAGGGNAGTGGMPEPADPHFKLLWRDDFDTFDTDRWTKQTHTFAENLARFSAANAVVEGGFLKLRVTKVQNGDKAYSAAELASKDQFTFGRFAGRIKFCAGSGMVSSLFTYKDDVNASWQEIDIEHLGNLPKSVQYNLISGNLNNRVYQPHVVTFQFAPPADFHDYSIEWTPSGVTFFVDGAQTHHDVQVTLKDAARLHMNAWPTNNAVTSFAGPFDPAAVPCEAQYDWVEAYSYTP